jgi:hypothetical protein
MYIGSAEMIFIKDLNEGERSQVEKCAFVAVCLGCYASLGATLCRAEVYGTQTTNRYCLHFTIYALYINRVRVYSLKELSLPA